MAASTLYYVYVSNADATFRPSKLGASATAPSAYRGSRYLATSGNGANWRFVGYVRTDGSTEFVDTAQNRLVVNYYNRRPLDVFANPGYVDDNGYTTYTTTSTTWVAANGGTGSRIAIISNGEDVTLIHGTATVVADTNSRLISIGLGVDSTTNATAGLFTEDHTTPDYHGTSFLWPQVYAEGYHTLDLLWNVSSAATITAYADNIRLGGTADARITGIYGSVMG